METERDLLAYRMGRVHWQIVTLPDGSYQWVLL